MYKNKAIYIQILTEKSLRNLLCEYILDDKIAFNDLIPERNK